ncbi:MAG: DUF3473 domain-containing protein [Pirellulales bacterium]|nr:DUF3473 domain-containing protein [Pirellulales bacterium]
MPIVNALTVDVEDYFQVSGFERRVSRDEWSAYHSRVVPNTERMLAIFAEKGAKATFFVLGWVAERFPALVRSIADAGHEVGCHSYWHRLIYEQSPAAFRADLRQSQQAIASALGRRATAYRAPSFSITRRSWWALEILAEEGFTVDSSIFPVHHDRYGIPDAPRVPHAIETPAGRIWEYPATVAPVGRVNVPVSGGGYFRLAPYRMTRALLRRVNLREQRPFMFYLHPWEIDADQPRLSAGNWRSRFRHYVNLSRTEAKLGRLLDDFRWGSMEESLDSLGAARLTASAPAADSPRLDALATADAGT